MSDDLATNIFRLNLCAELTGKAPRDLVVSDEDYLSVLRDSLRQIDEAKFAQALDDAFEVAIYADRLRRRREN